MTRPLVMGVVNVTPDSFSDGGRYVEPRAAVAHGLALVEAGADVLDVGGESTRPGATRPLVAEELARVVPVISELAAAGATVSVDTMRAEVARAALEAGAAIVNDVSGGLADPARLPTVAAGVPLERLVLDPGLGFAKRPAHNWELLRGLDEIASLGARLLVGASRKSFLGALLADGAGEPRPVDAREAAHLAVVLHCARAGVWAVRVHDVGSACDALAARAALEEPTSAAGG